MHRSAKMDASERDSRKWIKRSPFDLSRTLQVGGGLLVPYSLSGPPVVKQLTRMVTREPGQVGGFSQYASPNRIRYMEIIYVLWKTSKVLIFTTKWNFSMNSVLIFSVKTFICYWSIGSQIFLGHCSVFITGKIQISCYILWEEILFRNWRNQ